MSIPKEPRQLMINLMYLVLTALLALNVSAEILNAFTLVNKGISNTNTILTDKNGQIVSGIADKANEGQDPRAVEISKDAAKIQKITADFYSYVDMVKDSLISYTGGEIEDKHHEGEMKLKGESDTERPTTLMINKGLAAELKSEIEKVRKEYVAILNKWNGDAKVSQLTLNIDEEGAKARHLSWEEFNFYKVPTVAAVTILTKIQNDAKSAESTVLEHMANQIDAAKIKFDKMSAMVTAPTSYVKRGNEYTADIFIAASSEQAQIDVYLGSFTSAVKKDENGVFEEVEGTSPPLNNPQKIEVVGGMGKIKESASGKRDFQGVISLPDPIKPGTFKYYPFEFGYETFEVGEAVVSPTAMNVLYVGVDNPVKISVPGYASDKVTASGCGISKIKGEEYVARPATVGLDKINVTVNTGDGSKSFASEFRVRRIPDPYAYCGTSKGGTMKAGEFKQVSALTAKNPDFVFDIKYQVTGFEMLYAPKNGSLVSDVSNGATFTKMMEDIKTKAKPGDTIVFPRISVKMPDGTTRQLSMSFKLIG
jgi:gliding motility-associated protein GldM